MSFCFLFFVALPRVYNSIVFSPRVRIVPGISLRFIMY